MSTPSSPNRQDDRPLAAPPEADDRPLELEPDDEEERTGYGVNWSQRVSRKLHDEQALNASSAADGTKHDAAHETAIEANDVSIADRSVMGAEAGHMSDILRWALDSLHEPAIAAADWLARDIDPEQPTATALLTNPKITLLQVKQAKSVFKTMRIVGEKSADRRVGARMYAAAIAAGLVRHHCLISRQTPDALKRGFERLLDDQRMPQPLRDMAGMAICALDEKKYTIDAKDEPAHQPSPQRQPSAPKRSNGQALNGRGRQH
ncbi:MAG TPA: hypothetical protein VMS30_07285 [Phycisphaerales bacterium]|nr:hypothetical protein [Phycisphaerales bacterium]